MSEQFKDDDFLSQESNEEDVVALIKKMRQQLISLERKIDSLIEKPAHRSFGNKPFSKPSRSFGSSHRPFDRKHSNSSGETEVTRYRTVPRSEKRSDFGHNRQTTRRNDGQTHSIERKKPFIFKRKERG